MLVNVWDYTLKRALEQFIRPKFEPDDHTRVEFVAMQAQEGDKHTIHIGRSRWMCTLLLQAGVAYIARSNPMEMELRFPVAPVHVN